MTAKIIDGKLMAAQVKQEIKKTVAGLNQKPGLAVILVGEDPASKTYVGGKEKDSLEVGFYSQIKRLPATASSAEVIGLVEAYNKDPKIHGVLVQLPLPETMDEDDILNRIDPAKDVDGFTYINAGKLFSGNPGHVACTPAGCLEMLKRSGIDIKGKNAVVIGRSNIVGKPMAMLLLKEHATVTICHSRTKDLASVARQADILVAAIGKPKFVTADMVKDGAVVIDVGINRVDGKLIGDVDFDSVKEKASYITPVPGGVGLMTRAMLMQNTFNAYKTLNNL
ncbi:MAG: bifunctional methylenetetrahydrofolate dehydrogenase/methenyltetrahydrofolate cyclohydrolase FolD [Spirochaetia bacterium]|nr:bifunctional methylenetetrahydrofolate dehydrogenase/methenyltetrahydrofolate cyclohydrolase FolD [Spirochaetia bacterium]